MIKHLDSEGFIIIINICGLCLGQRRNATLLCANTNWTSCPNLPYFNITIIMPKLSSLYLKKCGITYNTFKRH